MTQLARPHARRILALQLGMSWLPEQAGNGLDRVFFNLIEHLPDVGVDVTGLVAGSGNVTLSSGGAVHAFAPDDASLYRRLLGARKAVGQVVTTQGPDLVAAHFAVYVAPALRQISSLPLVVHFHGPWAAESAAEGAPALRVRMKRKLEERVYRRADRLIVLSDAFKSLLCEEYGVDASRVRVVPGGVDVEHFATSLSRDEARTQLGWPTDRPIVLSVRRLARRMGLDRLIAAFADVQTRIPDALLFIAGKGPEGERLQALVRESELQDAIRFLGFVPESELPLAYRAADLSVVPTVALEGFGLTTVESLAAGTPVLVTPEGGLPEVVSGLSPDLVMPSDAAGDIASALGDALLGNVGMPDSEACRSYAREHFTWDQVASRTRSVYEEVLA